MSFLDDFVAGFDESCCGIWDSELDLYVCTQSCILDKQIMAT